MKQGKHDRSASKIDNTVRFPLQLNMLPYTNRARSRDSRENMELERSCTYDLLSVVVHVGEIETGHYVSYCRVGDQVRLASLVASSAWFLFLFSFFQTNDISGSNSTITRWSWPKYQMCLGHRHICCST